MRATRLALTKTSVNGRRYYCVTTPRLGGGRKRRFFKERAHAETYLQLAKVQQVNYGTAALSIPDALRVEAVACAQALEPFGVTLRDAVKFYLPHLHATKRSCTAAELGDELRKVKEADGASTRYLADLRSRLTSLQLSLMVNLSPGSAHRRLISGCEVSPTKIRGVLSPL